MPGLYWEANAYGHLHALVPSCTTVRVVQWDAGSVCGARTQVVDGGFQLVSLPQTSSKLVSRGEIDLVVASQRGIFVLEIKNWSGTLSTDGMKSHWSVSGS